MTKNKSILGYIFAIIAAMSFGLQPLFASKAYEYGVSSNMLAFLEALMLAVVFLIICLFTKSSLSIKFKSLLKVLLLALFGCSLTATLLYASYLYIDTSIATTLNFTYPIFVLVLSSVFYKDKFNKYVWISLVLCITGVVLFMNFDGNFTMLGFILALLSGLSYGLHILFSEKSHIMDEIPFNTYMFYYFFLSTILTAIINFIFDGKLNFNIEPKGYLFAGIVSFLGGVLAFALIQRAIKIIGGAKSSIIGALEPVTSIIAGTLFLNEKLKIINLIGIVLIIASTIILVLTSSKKPNIEE